MKTPVSNTPEDRMNIWPVRELGINGQGVSIALLDTGVNVQTHYDKMIEADRDFTGENHPRVKSYSHGNTVGACIHMIAPGANIQNLKVVLENGEMRKEHVVKAIQYCIEQFPKIRIINISLSFEQHEHDENCELCQAVGEAYRKGILVIAAAGNRGPEPNTLTCPALNRWCLASIATGTKDEIEWLKNMPWYKKAWYQHITGELAKMYGTSFSAGYLSGEAALMFSAFPKLHCDDLFFAYIDVMADLRKEGKVTMQTDRLFNKLKWMKEYSSLVTLTKPAGYLYPIVQPF